jgi:transposase
MAARALTMKQIRETLRLRFELGVDSTRKISKAIGAGKSAVANYLREAERLGVTSFSQVASLSETELEQLFNSNKVNRNEHGAISSEESLRLQKTLPDFSLIHEEMRRPGVTLMLLWGEYKNEHPTGYSYAQYRAYYQVYKGKLALVMRQTHRAGEKGFSDFSGDGFLLTDPKTGEKTKVEFFVASLGASSYTFACAVVTQTLPDWIDCHRRFFEWIQGVPAIMVPDNLKSGVKQPDRYEPEINLSYQQMAEYYGTCIIPARVKKPKDKAKVENAVLQAQRWILAVLRNRTFYTLSELNAAIRKCLVKLNSKVMRGYGKSRLELFELIDRPALKSLPAQPYEFAEWKRVRLGIDYHLRLDDHFYSAPFQLAKEELWIRSTGAVVEIFFQGKRVCSHVRSYVKWGKTTVKEHMPSHHRAYAEWTPERIISWAASIGPLTAQGVKLLIEQKAHPEQAYQSVLGIISLSKKHGNSRVERASQKALGIGSFCYKTLKTMLKNRMEDQPADPSLLPKIAKETQSQAQSETENQLSLWAKQNLRGQGYYH